MTRKYLGIFKRFQHISALEYQGKNLLTAKWIYGTTKPKGQ